MDARSVTVGLVRRSTLLPGTQAPFYQWFIPVNKPKWPNKLSNDILVCHYMIYIQKTMKYFICSQCSVSIYSTVLTAQYRKFHILLFCASPVQLDLCALCYKNCTSEDFYAKGNPPVHLFYKNIHLYQVRHTDLVI